MSYYDPFDPKSEIDKVSDTLYIGNFQTTKDAQTLIKYKIKTMVNCSRESHKKVIVVLKKNYKHLVLYDSPKEYILQHFQSFFEFIETHPNPAFVHCIAGISRAPTMVISYLMKKNSWTFKKAMGILKKIRPCIEPNHGFIEQLKVWHWINQKKRLKRVEEIKIKYKSISKELYDEWEGIF